MIHNLKPLPAFQERELPAQPCTKPELNSKGISDKRTLQKMRSLHFSVEEAALNSSANL